LRKKSENQIEVLSVQLLVTEGAGFTGSHLCEQLIEAGEEVICLDNFFTNTDTCEPRVLGAL
jgi:nucleoside-diphosphate-sugar epimerase